MHLGLEIIMLLNDNFVSFSFLNNKTIISFNLLSRKLNLLSFGEEAEEEEKELAASNTRIKSSHDVLNDPRLLKEGPETDLVMMWNCWWICYLVLHYFSTWLPTDDWRLSAKYVRTGEEGSEYKRCININRLDSLRKLSE